MLAKLPKDQYPGFTFNQKHNSEGYQVRLHIKRHEYLFQYNYKSFYFDLCRQKLLNNLLVDYFHKNCGKPIVQFIEWNMLQWIQQYNVNEVVDILSAYYLLKSEMKKNKNSTKIIITHLSKSFNYQDFSDFEHYFIRKLLKKRNKAFRNMIFFRKTQSSIVYSIDEFDKFSRNLMKTIIMYLLIMHY